MLFFGATGIFLIYMAVNKSNYWPKACCIPVRYVALFSLQQVVIQPFPLDLFTTTNNNNHISYIYKGLYIYLWQHQHFEKDGKVTLATSPSYISCMMTIGVASLLRMQTAILARLIKERRRRRRNMDNLIQTTNMWLHFATVPQRSRRTVFMNSRHKVFRVVHRIVCLFLLGQLLAASDNLFRVPCQYLGGWAAGSQACAKTVSPVLIVRFTVYKHAIFEISIDSDRLISGCRSDRSRTAIILIKVFTRRG